MSSGNDLVSHCHFLKRKVLFLKMIRTGNFHSTRVHLLRFIGFFLCIDLAPNLAYVNYLLFILSELIGTTFKTHPGFLFKKRKTTAALPNYHIFCKGFFFSYVEMVVLFLCKCSFQKSSLLFIIKISIISIIATFLLFRLIFPLRMMFVLFNHIFLFLFIFFVIYDAFKNL